jgi:urea transport system ATP-binding protein
MPAPLLEVIGLTRDFGGLHVLRGVNLRVEPGELRCIIGPNGCGKTTLFNVVSGAFAPTSGKVLWRGRDITGLPPHRISRLGVVRKFQVPGIYSTLSVAENLEIPALGRAAAAHPLGLLRDSPESSVQMSELVPGLQLPQQAQRRAGALAHGLKQWLEIAMLVRAQGQLLLLDEPTAGMSAAETSASVELIRRIQREQGVALLVIEHDMNFVRQLDCPVIVMLRGNVLLEGSYAQAQADPRVREAYLGYAAA